MLLWLIMGNKSYKAWRSAVLEPFWEMLSVLFEKKQDVTEVLSRPSENGVCYSYCLDRADDTGKVFIRRSAVQTKGAKQPVDKKCDLSLLNTEGGGCRPNDTIEGNYPKLNRDKVGFI